MDSQNFTQTIDWYDKHAQQCSLAWDDHFQPEQISTFVSMLPNKGKVLDAGCGTGRYSCLLRDSGLEVVGIDISQGMLKVAQQKHKEIKFIHGNFLHIDYPDEFFDGIWAHSSLIHFEHIEDVQKTLLEFKRLLKTGGILHLLLTCQCGNQRGAVVKNDLHPDGIFYRFFTKDEVHQLLDNLRYKILVLEEYDEAERYAEAIGNSRWIHALAQEL